MRLLLVEDDRKAARVPKKGLEEEGFVVDVAHGGDQGEELAAVTAYDVVAVTARQSSRICRISSG
ncbi:MAG: hypothetical protein A2X52_12380 [Candidatus Rokubacteria bacterium GWC2_70_16]|nr:MAG: hypothetical protein A2X52_12380 [Candidatus Rokubacteria bacterium GWC2_70_16]